MKDRDRVVAALKALREEGLDAPALVHALKSLDASIIEAISVTRDVLGISLQEAKETVALSPGYRDRASLSDQFHKALIELVEHGLPLCHNCGKYAISSALSLCILCHEIWRDASPEISNKIKTKPWNGLVPTLAERRDARDPSPPQGHPTTNP